MRVADIARGAAIGAAELVPGVSGGTIALILGIYEKALAQGDLLLRSPKKVDWRFLISVGVGMLGAVFLLSKPLHFFVVHYPQLANALFFGMVAASLRVPISMAERRHLIPGLIAAAIVFLSIGASAQINPSGAAIFCAAMVAICVLVLPGVSGSFILLALGLYEPVIGAVAHRDFITLGIFAAGALCGIVLFVRALNWALAHHRDLTLWIMAGLMLGSLRALWPELSLASVGMILLGVVVVSALTRTR